MLIPITFPQEGALFSADAVPVPGDMPIYEDLMASVRSIKKLMALGDIDMLLAAWDEPRAGEKALLALSGAIGYLQRIHSAVLSVSDREAGLGAMELCHRTLRELGLPEAMANPLIARSFQASLQGREALEISQDWASRGG